MISLRAHDSLARHLRRHAAEQTDMRLWELGGVGVIAATSEAKAWWHTAVSSLSPLRQLAEAEPIELWWAAIPTWFPFATSAEVQHVLGRRMTYHTYRAPAAFWTRIVKPGGCMLGEFVYA